MDTTPEFDGPWFFSLSGEILGGRGPYLSPSGMFIPFHYWDDDNDNDDSDNDDSMKPGTGMMIPIATTAVMTTP